MSGRTVLIAPDSFKGSLTSVQVAQALADGWRRARPDDEILLCPLADGGEGTLAAIEAAGGWQRRTSTARDPLGRQITARWLISDDGQRAAVEMAAASGLSLLTTDEQRPDPGDLDRDGRPHPGGAECPGQQHRPRASAAAPRRTAAPAC